MAWKERTPIIGVLVLLFAGTAHGAFPTIVTSTESTTATAVTSHVISLPTGIMFGDLLVVAMTSYGDIAFTWPSGWTSLCTDTGISGVTRTGVRYRVVDGTEAATITVTTGSAIASVHVALAIRNHGSTTTAPVCAVASADDPSPDPPSLDPAGGAVDELWLSGAGSFEAHTYTFSTNYTEVQQGQTVVVGAPASLGVASQALNATSEDPAAMSQSGGGRPWVAFTIAIHPGSEGGVQRITYVGAGVMGTTGNGQADPFTTPHANSQLNDILIIYSWTRDAADTTVITDYVQIAQVDTATGSHWWFWKRHDGSEGNATCNRTGTTGDSYCKMFVFRGVRTTGDPWNALGTPVADDGTGDPTSHASINTAAAGSMVVCLIGYEDDDATTPGVMTGTDPANYTEIYEESSNGADGTIVMGYELRTTAGATGTISYAYSTITSRSAAGNEGSLVLSLAPVPSAVSTKMTLLGVGP